MDITIIYFYILFKNCIRFEFYFGFFQNDLKC